MARSNRAGVYLKLGKYTEALQDVSAAVKLLPTEIALYRKGCVCLLVPVLVLAPPHPSQAVAVLKLLNLRTVAAPIEKACVMCMLCS